MEQKQLHLPQFFISQAIMIQKTFLIGQNLLKFPSLPSTNSFLLDALKNSAIKEGTVVLTYNQTQGKGQRSNSWLVEPNKNLTFSTLFRPTFLPIEKQFLISIAFSNAVIEFLNEELKLKAELKWPNDIYVGKKKSGGILIENVLSGNKIKHSVVGLGLNVNQEKFDIETATSLKNETGKEFNIDELLKNLLGYVENSYSALKNDNEEELKSTYYQHLKGFQTFLDYQILDSEEIVSLKLIEISNSGIATFADKKGKGYHFGFKEIRMLF